MYDYQKERSGIFTDEGQRLFLRIRDRIYSLVQTSGACTIERVLTSISGDTFQALACIDRLEEIGEIRILRDKIKSTSLWVIIPAK